MTAPEPRPQPRIAILVPCLDEAATIAKVVDDFRRELPDAVVYVYDNVSTDVTLFNHVPGGANVLYLDGHVKFLRYPGAPPVNAALAGIMNLFDSLPGPPVR